MRRTIKISVALLALAISLTARPSDDDDTLMLARGHSLTDTIDDSALAMRIHARTSLPRKSGQWRLVWNMQDSLNYRSATFTIPEAVMFDDIFIGTSNITVSQTIDGREEVITSYDVENNHVKLGGGKNSIKIFVDPYTARMYCGDDKQFFVGTIPFDRLNPGIIGIQALNAPLKIHKFDIGIYKIDHIQKYDFESTEALYEYLKRPDRKKHEGIWQHFDEDMDSSLAFVAGRYTFAIVHTPGTPDDYDIVYIDGLRTQNGSLEWQPLDIKGHLHSTQFIDTYRLTWRDSKGNVTHDDQWAIFDPNGAMVTFRFPLLSSSVRYERLQVK